MSNKPRLVTARHTLSNLRKWLMSDKMKEKYLNIDDDGKLHFKPGKPSLDNDDINTVVNYIKKALSESTGSLPRSSIVFKFSDEEINKHIENYLKGLLSTMPYHDNDFLRFIKELTNIEQTKADPYSITDENNKNNPNVITNIIYYALNSKQPIRLYDKLPTTDELIGIVINDATQQAKAKANEAYAQVIKEKQKQLKDLEGKLSEYENNVSNLNSQIEKLTYKLEKGKGDKQAIEKELEQKNAELEKTMKGLEITKKDYSYVLNGIEELLDDSGKQNIALNELLGDSKVQNAALGKLLERNRSRELDERANKLIGDKQPIKSRIDSIREQLAAEKFNENEINQIIAKALSKEEHYKRVVAANQDLFDRDMSPSTIQNENEQFQSKLRQQNLRYILPAFIERREKLVENTLNPNLLKGAFAI